MEKEKTINVKKAFLLTGHRNWGKSKTLNNPNFAGKNKHIIINGNYVFIIKMSNDDQLDRLLEAIKKHKDIPYLVIAFCCNFEEGFFTVEILEALKKYDYEVFSFVLEHQYNNPEISVTSEQIAKLKKHAICEIYSVKKAESNVRAVAFKKYLEKNIP
jgi:hypothetical protein